MKKLLCKVIVCSSGYILGEITGLSQGVARNSAISTEEAMAPWAANGFGDVWRSPLTQDRWVEVQLLQKRPRSTGGGVGSVLNQGLDDACEPIGVHQAIGIGLIDDFSARMCQATAKSPLLSLAWYLFEERSLPPECALR